MGVPFRLRPCHETSEFSMKDLLERGPGEAYWIAVGLEEVF
jgi:hypothetical protein